MKNKKMIFQIVFFIVVMGLTFYAVLYGENLGEIQASINKMAAGSLLLAILIALFYLSIEGFMTWYLLRSVGGVSSLLRCICYTFIGFFYSGITPSASGGQPMQLYYMKKDGNRLSNSSVVLLTIALTYKLVLVLFGIMMLLFWREPLQNYLGHYFKLYLLGFTLNILLVIFLILVMVLPQLIKGIIKKLESFFVYIRILKYSEKRIKKIDRFIDGYHDAVLFFATHKRKILVVLLLTFVQRICIHLLTVTVYHGFSLSGTGAWTIILLHVSIYLAVDMLPIPGAQGITEVMYKGIFTGIFTEGLVKPAMCVTRGISFYFLLLVGMLVIIVDHIVDYCKNARGKS